MVREHGEYSTPLWPALLCLGRFSVEMSDLIQCRGRQRTDACTSPWHVGVSSHLSDLGAVHRNRLILKEAPLLGGSL